MKTRPNKQWKSPQYRALTVLVSFALMLPFLQGCTSKSSPVGQTSPNGLFKVVAELKMHRYQGQAIPLSDGRIVVTGAINKSDIDKVEQKYGKDFHKFQEIYNPKTNQSELIDIPNMPIVKLPDDRLFIYDPRGTYCGGENIQPDCKITSDHAAFIYDVHTDKTQEGPIVSIVRREGGNLTPLPDGRVLITGGSGYFIDPTTRKVTQYDPKKHLDYIKRFSLVQIFDPKTLTFSKAGQLKAARDHGVALLLKGEQALLSAGGICGLTEGEGPSSYKLNNIGCRPIDLYDVKEKKSKVVANALHSVEDMVQIDNHRVLLLEGYFLQGLLNLTTGDIKPIYSANESSGRHGFLLPDGRVLILGSRDVELYDPKTNIIRLIDELAIPREAYVATMTKDNRIYIFNGLLIGRKGQLAGDWVSEGGYLNAVEMFDYNELKRKGI